MDALAWGIVIDGTSAGAINSGSYSYVAIGESGSASLTANGATVIANNTAIGEYVGSYGSVSLISGTWTNYNQLNIGQYGTGVLTLSGNSLTVHGGSYIGSMVGSYGSVGITSGTWANKSILEVGAAGSGLLTISGGYVSDLYAYISNGSTANGTVKINSGTWTTSTDLYIGASGTGRLSISGGIVSASWVHIGDYGQGTVDISKGDLNASELYIGGHGTGAISIQSGEIYDINTYIGHGAGGSGNVQLSGGQWINTGNLIVGFVSQSSGTLSMSGGHLVDSEAHIGLGSGANAAAIISGGEWTTSGNLFVGEGGQGTLGIEGGLVSASSSFIVNGGSATVSGGTWNNSYAVAVGSSGTGTLAISGGYVTDCLGQLGGAAGTLGNATVTGGTWVNTFLVLGNTGGNGVLTIDGGVVTASESYVGSYGGTGSVVLKSGSWVSSWISVGNQGTGTVAINGGSVDAIGTRIGLYASDIGSVSITQGSWNSMDFSVGYAGTGTMAVSGGFLWVRSLELGTTQTGLGTLSVTGGGVDVLNGAMGVGESGTGTLNLDADGALMIGVGDGLLVLASGTGSVGTLNLGTGGTSAGTLYAAAVVGGSGVATVNFNSSGQHTYDQIFAGNLSVNVIGTGLTVFTGENAYTGPTLIRSGTLQIGNGGVSGELPGDVENQSVLVFNRSGAVTSYGVISGTGSLIQNGPGTLVLTGNNTYTGVTSILSGTLQVGNGGTSGWISDTVVDNGILVFNRSDLVIYSGSISGTGSLVQSGSGTLILTGSNTYSGPTVIESGTLLIGLGGTGGTLPGNVTNNDTLIFASPGLFTCAGAISGTGGLIQSGTGELMLTGSNTYTGAITVVGGTLAVNGSITSDVVVMGGILGGSGVITGNVSNQSVVSPGNSPGTLTINGNYNQGASGALLIQIASGSVFDRLIVTGIASLGGAVEFELLNGYTLHRGDRFTFLTAGSVSGAFSTSNVANFETGTPVKVLLEYSGTAVTLEATQGSFAAIDGLTPNQRAVARALDRVVESPKVAGLVDLLDRTANGAIPSKLERIVPTELAPMFDAIISFDQVQTSNLEQRMQEIRNGAPGGFSASGLNLIDPHGTRSAAGSSGTTQAIGKDGKALAPAPIDSRWGFFANGSGEWVDEESSAIARGAEFATSGITAGADYRWGDHAAFGLTAGYANTLGSGYAKNPVRIDSGKLGAYGTLFGCGAYLNGALGGGFNDYDTRRDSLNGTARGDTDGTDFNAMLGGGWNYTRGRFSVGPLASVRYSWVGIDGFDEHGSLAPLKIGSQSADSLKSALGVQASTVVPVGKMALSPQVKVQWLHEYLESARGIGASFLPGGDFTVFGPDLGRDSLQLDVGASLQLSPSVGVYAFYIAELGRSNTSSQSVNGGVQVKF